MLLCVNAWRVDTMGLLGSELLLAALSVNNLEHCMVFLEVSWCILHHQSELSFLYFRHV